MAPKIYLIAFFILCMFCDINCKIKHIKDSDSTPNKDGLHPYTNGMNPGMALRLE